MSDQVHILLYTSQATHYFTDSQVAEMSIRFSQNNERNHVTGILLYDRGHFLQLLEGEKMNVHYTFKKIRDDQRHKSVTLLVDQDFGEKRLFSGWSMKFESMAKFDPDMSEQVRNLMMRKPGSPIEIMTLLYDFLKKSDNR